jgi:hypothetical protein
MRTVVRPSVGPRPLTVSAAGLVGVLLIHAALVLPFVIGLSPAAPKRPNTTGAGATAFLSAAEPDMTVVFIDEPTENAAAREAPPLASLGTTPPDLQLVVASPDPSPPAITTAKTDDAAQDNATAAAEAVEHAKLYGRYVGQVQARIERAWMRPRTEIGAPRFSCHVRVQQDRRGELTGISLDHCNGTERWQQSLMSAIRTASPLPAPPDASVYADVLWLSVSSTPFEEGDSQGFEPESRTKDDSERTATESFERFATGTHRDGDKSIVHLTIIGSPVGQSAAASTSESQLAHPLPE